MLSSRSFAVFETNLDSCPKCGKNVCEHASVADVINLPNSLSQDFSTYSSDSSLIKQLLSESTSSTTTATSSTINFEPKISLKAINELFIRQNNNNNNSQNGYNGHNGINNVKKTNNGCNGGQAEPEPPAKKRKFRLFNKNRQLNCLSSSSSSSSSPSPSSPSSALSSSSFEEPTKPTYISVKLNNFYYYNYEKTVSKSTSSSSTASSTITDSVITEIHRPTNVNIIENRLDNYSHKHINQSSTNESNCPSAYYQNNQNNHNYHNYHKITVIFVLMGLFSFNFLQQTFLLIYYFNSSQYEWLLSSVIGVFTGQCLTLLVSFISEIKPSKQIVFKNPFSKLCLLVPGYLPLSSFVQFFRLILNYKKSCAQDKFRLEFNLSLLFYFNSLFYTLPLIVVNSCYLSSNSRLNWYYTDLLTVSSDATIMFIFSPDARPRNQFMILLVSVFVSISIGLCLFITYYELAKQMSMLTTLRRFTPDTQWLRLGIIELLVYFCFKFCLITSRLCILALFWYMFNQFLLVFASVHILLLFLSNVNTLSQLFKCTRPSNADKQPSSTLNDLITIKIVSILGLIDLFVNQANELNNTRRVFAYYLLNFVQNSLILTYWLFKVLHNEHASQKIRYTTLIYLSVLLFNVFGLILKYLHIHIIKKRYAKLIELRAITLNTTATTTAHAYNK